MQQRASVRLSVTAIIAALVGSLLAFLAPQAAHAASARPGYSAEAYGHHATIGTTAESGPTSQVFIGCTQTSGIVQTNTAAALTLPAGLGSVGAVSTRASTAAMVSGYKSSADSRVAGANLLGGLVTADAVHTTSSAKSSGTTLSAQGAATFVGLRVAGVPVSASPAPNTTLTLPGVGSVVLNEQVTTQTSKKISRSTYGIDVRVTNPGNPLGLPVGTRLIVAKAIAGITTPLAGLLGGSAYGSTVAVGSTLTSGPTSIVPVPCEGGTRTSRIARVSVTGVTLGTVQTVASGISSATSLTAHTRASIADVSLLGGVVHATGVVADTRASRTGTTRSTADASTLYSLRIAGHPVSVHVAPGTVYGVPGVGTLAIHRQTRTASSIAVTMLTLTVTRSGNSLPVGAVVRIAYSSAIVR